MTSKTPVALSLRTSASELQCHEPTAKHAIWARFYASALAKNDPKTLNLGYGNPHSVMPGFVNILQKAAVPPPSEANDYYRYAVQHDFLKERQFIANEKLKNVTNPSVSAKDILLTTGAFAGLYASISAILNPSEEVLYLSPGWFYYHAMITVNQGMPIPLNIIHCRANQQILQMIANNITSKTRILILNTPHNPTGILFTQSELQFLANLLTAKSKEHGKHIWLLSDEAYRDFVYDGVEYLSPIQFYPYSVLIYTYGKILLAPQQRLGFMAVSPLLFKKSKSQKRTVLDSLRTFLICSGFQYPNVIPGRALIQLEQQISATLTPMLAAYTMKRNLIHDTLVRKLRPQNYQMYPKSGRGGTFYFLYRIPTEYGLTDIEYLKLFYEREKVLLLPGCTMGLTVEREQYWIRVTYTASVEMIRDFCQRLVRFDQYLQQQTNKKSIQSKL